MQELRANTAVDVLIGPFVDDADGDTPITGSTLVVELSKNGQGLATKNDATDPVHDAGGTVDGYYNCELDSTDTNTEGTLTLVVHHADSLPIRHDYMVLAEAAWDSKYAAKDTGLMDVHVKTVEAGIIANASFNADVGSTAHGTNIIALACRKILEELNLDHLLKVDTTVAADGDLEDYCVGGTIIAHLLAISADATDYKASTDSMQAIRDYTAPSGEYDTEMARITGNVALASGVDLTHIMGTILTEGGAGRLAASLIKLLDVAIPLLVASDVMRGTDSAALASVCTEARLQTLTDWINGGRLDLILDIIAADTTTDIPALIATAQADLDLLTGADGATLATAQGLYAPNKVVPDAAGIAPTAAEIVTAMEADGGDLSSLMEALVNKLLITEASGNAEIFNDAGASQGTVAAAFTSVAGVTQRKRMII